MGNREDLLAAAKRCVRKKGFTRTTARDIATASGVSLAAIGYHFGSKEALLTEAMVQATGEWVDELARTLAADFDPNASSTERFELIWTRLLKLFRSHRQLWAANFEISPYIDTVPEVRKVMAAAQHKARLGLAELFLGIDGSVDPKLAQSTGGFFYALLAGVMTQWLIDPENAPSASDLTKALLAVAAGAGPIGAKRR
jgi:AcrR family transcriptional regulator